MIVFDLQAIQSVGSSERGIARYVTETVSALVSVADRDVVDRFLWNDRLPWTDRISALGVNDRLLSFSDVRGHDVDVLHVNSPFEVPAIGDLLPPVRAQRLVVTCYDIIPRLFPHWYLESRHKSSAYRRRLGLLLAADAVVTDSQSAADDVVEHLGVDPRRVTVLGAGVASVFTPPASSLEERISALRSSWPQISARYVLVPTAADQRKNTIGALRAFADLPISLRQRHQLVMFCRLSHGQRLELERQAERLGIADRVVFTGFVPDDLLVPLYQSAELVFVPTFYEGFGLPVVEARHCGARVICSNSSSLREVMPDLEARFNPHDPADMTRALERALTDAEFAARLDRVPDAGFTWDGVADRLADLYRDLAVSVVESVVPDRIRVGVVGRLDRQGDPEVEFCLNEVVARLAADGRFSTTAFTVGEPPVETLRPPCPASPLTALFETWLAGDLDMVVYVAGERTLRRIAPLMFSVPGCFVPFGKVAADLADRLIARFDVVDDLVDRLVATRP